MNSQTAFLVVGLKEGWPICSACPRICSVLALKVQHPGNPLSPGQTGTVGHLIEGKHCIKLTAHCNNLLSSPLGPQRRWSGNPLSTTTLPKTFSLRSLVTFLLSNQMDAYFISLKQWTFSLFILSWDSFLLASITSLALPRCFPEWMWLRWPSRT